MLLLTDGELPIFRSGGTLVPPPPPTAPPLWADADVDVEDDDDDDEEGGGGDVDSMRVLSIFMILYCVADLLHATR